MNLPSAWEEYDELGERRDHANREENAYKVACATVKKNYEKGEKISE